MTKTWEEIRDEVAGMLADGVPLEDITGKLEKLKNEYQKQLTNEDYIRSCSTKELAEVLWERINGAFNSGYACCKLKQDKDYVGRYKRFKEWLKQPHTAK